MEQMALSAVRGIFLSIYDLLGSDPYKWGVFLVSGDRRKQWLYRLSICVAYFNRVFRISELFFRHQWSWWIGSTGDDYTAYCRILCRRLCLWCLVEWNVEAGYSRVDIYRTGLFNWSPRATRGPNVAQMRLPAYKGKSRYIAVLLSLFLYFHADDKSEIQIVSLLF